MFFLFIILNIFCCSLLACKISAEKSGDNFMGSPFYIICCFSLVALNIFCLHLLLVHSVNVSQFVVL